MIVQNILTKLWAFYSSPPTLPAAYRSIEVSSPRLPYGRAANYRCLIIPEGSSRYTVAIRISVLLLRLPGRGIAAHLFGIVEVRVL